MSDNFQVTCGSGSCGTIHVGAGDAEAALAQLRKSGCLHLKAAAVEKGPLNTCLLHDMAHRGDSRREKQLSASGNGKPSFAENGLYDWPSFTNRLQHAQHMGSGAPQYDASQEALRRLRANASEVSVTVDLILVSLLLLLIFYSFFFHYYYYYYFYYYHHYYCSFLSQALSLSLSLCLSFSLSLSLSLSLCGSYRSFETTDRAGCAREQTTPLPMWLRMAC